MPRDLPTQSTTYPTVYQTIADASHPMYLYNLQPLLSTTTPIKYASRPTPVTIPGNPTPASLECFGLPSGECYADARRGLRGNAGAAADAQAAALGPRTLSPTSAGSSTTTTTTSSCPSLTTPTWIPSTYGASRVSSACSCILSSATAATVTAYAVSTAAAATSVCTTYTSAHPQSTYAAYCDPSLYVNALASPTTPAGVSAAQTTVSVDSRIDCCQACAGIFNCVFWKYLPQTTFAPNAQFAGGFDPWAPGSCVVGYQDRATSTPRAAGAPTSAPTAWPASSSTSARAPTPSPSTTPACTTTAGTRGLAAPPTTYTRATRSVAVTIMLFAMLD